MGVAVIAPPNARRDHLFAAKRTKIGFTQPSAMISAHLFIHTHGIMKRIPASGLDDDSITKKHRQQEIAAATDAPWSALHVLVVVGKK